MEYIDYSKYFTTYTPFVEEKKDKTTVDFADIRSNLDWNTPTYDFSISMPETKSKTFDDLFGTSETTRTDYMLTQQTTPISGNLNAAIDKQLGKPYALGGGHTGNINSKTLDCSGFVTLCFRDAYGINLEGRARDIYNNKNLVSVSSAKPGDIIFFRGTTDDSRAHGNYVSHVGIITKVDSSGKPIEIAHASARQYGKTVKVPYTNYWNKYKPEIKRLKT